MEYNENNCIHTLFVLFLTLCGVFFLNSETKGDENLVKIIGVGVNEWIDNSEFKCSYFYTEGVVDTKEKAEKQPDNLDKITLVAEGQFVKTKRKTFVSQLVKQDLYTPRQSRSFFGVINEQLEAHYIPHNFDGPPQELFVFERDKDKKDIPYPVVEPQTTFNPVNYITNITSLADVIRKIDPNVAITTSRIDADNIEVSFRFNDSAGNQNLERVVFLTSYMFPVPVESYVMVTYVTGEEYIRKCVASDFVDVGSGVRVPKKIMQYEGPFFDWRGEEYEGKWLVKKWVSTDMGREEPIDADFLIPLASNSTFGGLVTELEIEFMRTKPSYFDIDSLSLADLQISSLGEDIVASNMSRAFYLRVFFILAGSALILIACIRITQMMLTKNG